MAKQLSRTTSVKLVITHEDGSVREEDFSAYQDMYMEVHPETRREYPDPPEERMVATVKFYGPWKEAE